MDVDDFIKREVTNQGHDIDNPDDGGIRVVWMQSAWKLAQGHSLHPTDICPTSETIETLGRKVEQVVNRNGFRGVLVGVGGRICPAPADVDALMGFYAQHVLRSDIPAIEAYRVFQLIHPFRDGNGRVGKIIYNWLLGKLDDPEMPPDLFGGGVP